MKSIVDGIRSKSPEGMSASLSTGHHLVRHSLSLRNIKTHNGIVHIKETPKYLGDRMTIAIKEYTMSLLIEWEGLAGRYLA